MLEDMAGDVDVEGNQQVVSCKERKQCFDDNSKRFVQWGYRDDGGLSTIPV